MWNNYKVYCLINKITNEKYVGVTKQNLYNRCKNGKGYKINTKIYKAIEKYGWNNFIHKILSETNSKYIAGEMEKYYINEYDTINNGYNMQSGGFRNFIGAKATTEAKKKISIANKGKHYSPQTEFKKGERNKYTLSIMKSVMCIETGIIYDCIADAEKKLNISHHIWDCINGKRKKCGGYHWKLVGGEE